MPSPEVEDPNLLLGDELDELEDDDVDEEEEEEEYEQKPNIHKRKHEENNGIAAFPSPSTSSYSSHDNPQGLQNPNPNLLSAPAGIPPSSATEQSRQTAAVADESRRIFQRLWTDEDEISLLQGFLEYTSERRRRGARGGATNYDTGPFYDRIKTRFHLDFNKSQLVEKLRRLKKKYRNVTSRIGSGRDFAFKTPHDQITYELSRQIWSDSPPAITAIAMDDHLDLNGGSNNGEETKIRDNSVDPATTPATAMDEDLPEFPRPATPSAATPGFPNVIEDTVRSCLSPLFKELLHCAMSGPSNPAVGGMALNPLPLNFGGNPMNFGGNSINVAASLEGVDERWRKQQILELEVYSKRLELVQEQIKVALEELKSAGS